MVREGRIIAILLIAVGALGGLAATPAMAQAAGSNLEYAVKANYLVRFAAFVEWPPRAFQGPAAPVVICVAGRDPFGATLDRAARGQTAFGRSLAVRRPATREAAADCHILYIGDGAGSMIAATAGQSGTLVVTDAASGPERGMIHFVVSEARVRFHIDKRSAMRGGLTISSRLLNLALTVREG